MRARHGVPLEQQSQLDLQGRVGMVCRQPLDFPARIRYARESPTCAIVTLSCRKIDSATSSPSGPCPATPGTPWLPRHRISPHQVGDRTRRFGLLKDRKCSLPASRLAISPFLSPPTPSARMAMLPFVPPLLKFLRLPENDVILVVVANRPCARQLMALYFHLVVSLVILFASLGRDSSLKASATLASGLEGTRTGSKINPAILPQGWPGRLAHCLVSSS